MRTSTQARWLGYGGLLPFVVAVAGLAFVDRWADLASVALVAYGAVILSFVGAVHWGIGLVRSGTGPSLLLCVSVVPALLAWLSLLLPAAAGLGLQIVAFALLYGYERVTLWDYGFPDWYRDLRQRLTAGVVMLLAAGFALAVIRG